MAATGALAQKPWQPVSRTSTFFSRPRLAISRTNASLASSAPYALHPVMQMRTTILFGSLSCLILARRASRSDVDLNLFTLSPFAYLYCESMAGTFGPTSLP